MCPDNSSSCYFSYTSTPYSFAQARAACAALNGTVAIYGDAQEQLAVEQYFAVSSVEPSRKLNRQTNARVGADVNSLILAGRQLAAGKLLGRRELRRSPGALGHRGRR